MQLKISSPVFFKKTHCETQAINLFFSDFLTTKFEKFLLQREKESLSCHYNSNNCCIYKQPARYLSGMV